LEQTANHQLDPLVADVSQHRFGWRLLRRRQSPPLKPL
jgi:hypothetical protein